MRIKPLPGMLKKVEQMIQEIPEVIECDKVTGEDCFIVRLVAHSMEQLDHILDKLAERAQSNTSIVKTTPVKRRLPPLL
ncbi:AsnC family protein [compost metagenome]